MLPQLPELVLIEHCSFSVFLQLLCRFLCLNLLATLIFFALTQVVLVLHISKHLLHKIVVVKFTIIVIFFILLVSAFSFLLDLGSSASTIVVRGIHVPCYLPISIIRVTVVHEMVLSKIS